MTGATAVIMDTQEKCASGLAAGYMFLLLCLGIMPYVAATAQSTVQRPAVETVADREERDTADKLRAMAVCGSSYTTMEAPDLAVACETAYKHVLESGDYLQAMHYALLGCEKYRFPALCRRVGGLPLLIGNSGMEVPPTFRGSLQRAALAVCQSAGRYKTIAGTDVTARECRYLSRFFVLARDPEYTAALGTQAMRFYESIYDRANAGQLSALGCKSLAAQKSCDPANNRVVPVRHAASPRRSTRTTNDVDTTIAK